MVKILGKRFDASDRESIEVRQYVKSLEMLYLKYGDFWCHRLCEAENDSKRKWDRWYMFTEVKQHLDLLDSVNQRQIMLNEVIVDLDNKDFKVNKIAEDFIKERNPLLKMSFWPSGGKGIHISVFFDKAAFWEFYYFHKQNSSAIQTVKTALVKKIVGPLYVGEDGMIDFQRCSLKATIQSEYTDHRKTGKMKTCSGGEENFMVENPITTDDLRDLLMAERPPKVSCITHKNGRKLRKCAASEYAYSHQLSDCYNRMTYFLASRFKRANLSQDDALKRIQQFIDFQNKPDLRRGYGEGVIRYIYSSNDSHTCGCKWFNDVVKTGSDPGLKEACLHCKSKRGLVE